MKRLKKFGLTALSVLSILCMPISAFAEPVGDAGISTDIIASSTMPSETNTASVAVQADVPEKFGLTITLTLMNRDSKQKIQFNLYADNRHYDVGYVSPGTYDVLSCKVAEDISNKYPFETIQPFTVGANETKMLTPTLKDRTSVEKAISVSAGTKTTEETDKTDKAKAIEDYVSPYADFEGLEIDHTGTGTGLLFITGKQNGLYDIVVKITSSGTMGDMKFIYSMDGGETWSEETDVPLNGDVDLQVMTSKGLKASGLTATFDASPLAERPFVADDTYTAYAPDPNTNLIVRNGTEVTNKVIVRPTDRTKHPFDIIYDNGYDIRIKFTKPGSFGTAVYTSTVDGKTWTDECYLSEDGIVKVNDELTVDLSQLRNFTYGQMITITAERHNNSRIIVVAVVLVAAALTAFILFIKKLKSQIPGRNNYEIFPYESMGSTEQKGRK